MRWWHKCQSDAVTNMTSYGRVFTWKSTSKVARCMYIKQPPSDKHAMRVFTRHTDRRHGRPRFVPIPRSVALADVKSPVKEIPAVIHLLTQSPPSLQRATIEKYFTPDAAFSHPFCRTWSGPNSRWLVNATYRWYKIMSPRIDLTVQSVGMLRRVVHTVYTELGTNSHW